MRRGYFAYVASEWSSWAKFKGGSTQNFKEPAREREREREREYY